MTMRADGAFAGEAVDLCDVRVIEGRERLRFAIEACEALRFEREVGWQDLQRDVALELRVAGLVDLAHATRADEGVNLVGTETRAGGESHRNPPGIRRGQGTRILPPEPLRAAGSSAIGQPPDSGHEVTWARADSQILRTRGSNPWRLSAFARASGGTGLRPELRRDRPRQLTVRALTHQTSRLAILNSRF